MRIVPAILGVLALASPGFAEEKEPFAARTTQFLFTPQHTHERAGTVNPIARYAGPGKSPYESTGYVGGGKLVHGEGRGVQDGTFGWDYTGFGRRPGRIFLGWFHDSPKQTPILNRYSSEGPRVKDVVASQPFKKAVREAKEEKRSGGHEE